MKKNQSMELVQGVWSPRSIIDLEMQHETVNYDKNGAMYIGYAKAFDDMCEFLLKREQMHDGMWLRERDLLR